MLLRKISSIIERIDSRYLFALGGIAVLCLLMAIVSSEGGSATMLWLIGAVLSVCIFFVILILKIAYYFIAGSVSATKETLEAIRDRKSSPKKPKKKNIPLIVAGIVVLVAVTPYVGEGGALIPILQACGLIVVLAGFGVPFFRRSNSARGTAKATARTMLRSLMAVQQERQYPINTDEGKMFLYADVLKMRPGYTDEMIDNILASAMRLGKMSTPASEPQGFTFNVVVSLVVKSEFEQTWRRMPTSTEQQQMFVGIEEGLTP